MENKVSFEVELDDYGIQTSHSFDDYYDAVEYYNKLCDKYSTLEYQSDSDNYDDKYNVYVYMFEVSESGYRDLIYSNQYEVDFE